MMKKAVFLDRDGVINEIVYFEDLELLDCPLKADQFKLLPGSAGAIKQINDLGLLAVVITNQPAVAKKKTTLEELEKMNSKMRDELAKTGAKLDGIYACLHHPRGKDPEYTAECECRKPKSGLLKKAAEELDIDLKTSYMVGDSWSDIKAGQDAGCKTILLGKVGKCDYCKLLEEKNVKPDSIVNDLNDAVQLIKSWEEK